MYGSVRALGALAPCALATVLACSLDDRRVQAPEGSSASEGSSNSEGSVGSNAVTGNEAPGGASDDGASSDGAAAGEEPSSNPPDSSSGAQLASAGGSSGLPGGDAAGASPGGCAPGTQRCEAGVLELCNDDGVWASVGTSCGQCVPDTVECAGATRRVCTSSGAWLDVLQCSGSHPVCNAAAGKCVCNESSCPPGQICSSETLECVQEVSDCPVPSPLQVSEDHTFGVVSVRFDEATGSADVRLQNITTTSTVFFATAVCNGPDTCALVRDGLQLQLGPRQTVDATIQNTRVEGGELVFLNNNPEEATFAYAYVTWGNGPSTERFVSLVNESAPNSWRPGQSVQIEPGDTGFVATGNTNEAAGYTSCRPARFTP